MIIRFIIILYNKAKMLKKCKNCIWFVLFASVLYILIKHIFDSSDLFSRSNDSDYQFTIKAFNYYRKNVADLCKTSDNTDIIFTYVFSPSSNFQQRNVIRETWGNRSLFPNLKVAFVVSVSVIKSIHTLLFDEVKQYGDIIQGNFFDSYRNLTMKSILAWKFVAVRVLVQ